MRQALGARVLEIQSVSVLWAAVSFRKITIDKRLTLRPRTNFRNAPVPSSPAFLQLSFHNSVYYSNLRKSFLLCVTSSIAEVPYKEKVIHA